MQNIGRKHTFEAVRGSSGRDHRMYAQGCTRLYKELHYAGSKFTSPRTTPIACQENIACQEKNKIIELYFQIKKNVMSTYIWVQLSFNR